MKLYLRLFCSHLVQEVVHIRVGELELVLMTIFQLTLVQESRSTWVTWVSLSLLFISSLGTGKSFYKGHLGDPELAVY
jgi:hypothetical protein